MPPIWHRAWHSRWHRGVARMPTTVLQAHLERRGSLYYWRRRWPKPVLDRAPQNFLSRKFLLFPLRLNVLRDAKGGTRGGREPGQPPARRDRGRSGKGQARGHRASPAGRDGHQAPPAHQGRGRDAPRASARRREPVLELRLTDQSDSSEARIGKRRVWRTGSTSGSTRRHRRSGRQSSPPAMSVMRPRCPNSSTRSRPNSRSAAVGLRTPMAPSTRANATRPSPPTVPRRSGMPSSGITAGIAQRPRCTASRCWGQRLAARDFDCRVAE